MSTSLGQLPSTGQTTWHGGISTTTFHNFFDPIFNEAIYDDLTLGRQAEASDFNRDVYPDITVVSFLSTSSVILLVNPGISTPADEEWNPVVISPSLPQCQSVFSADIDADSDLNVIIGFSGTTGIAWLQATTMGIHS